MRYDFSAGQFVCGFCVKCNGKVPYCDIQCKTCGTHTDIMRNIDKKELHKAVLERIAKSNLLTSNT